MIFDTHCHLNCDELYENIDLYLDRALKAGVTNFMVVGYDKESSIKAVEIANKYKNIYAIIGFHPTEIHNLSEEDFQEIVNLMKNPKVKAVGEIGLDYHWEKDEKDIKEQKKYFVRQIDIANELNLPISIHCRDAIGDTLQILKEHPVKCGGVMHCYSGPVELLDEFYKLGFYISLGGPVTFKNAKTPKEVAKEVRLDRLLVETDSPYLAPHPHRGQQNEPSYITFVLENISLLKEMKYDDLVEQTYKNACKLFKI